MKITGNTILITGGGSGIGFETARRSAEAGNEVIITGRNKAKLDVAAARLPRTTAIAADINDEQQVDQLVERLHTESPRLNVLMNNAAQAYAYTLADSADVVGNAMEEMMTNYFSTIRLTEKLRPSLEEKS